MKCLNTPGEFKTVKKKYYLKVIFILEPYHCILNHISADLFLHLGFSILSGLKPDRRVQVSGSF